ncbi:hypothetical protein BKA70DRAFT_1524408 [Coprinopsis sp. MPI-PUGE-AT-0042]|nr:hypothetical protein BKA70DRAFT_1524408 [Coprinopsis sp. MPI-PUGE-AT-0042]
MSLYSKEALRNHAEALNHPKLIMWDTSTKIDVSLRIRTELLPNCQDSTEALPGCEIISATLTQRGARIGVHWDNEDWTGVITESGVRDMNLELERTLMAAEAQIAQDRVQPKIGLIPRDVSCSGGPLNEFFGVGRLTFPSVRAERQIEGDARNWLIQNRTSDATSSQALRTMSPRPEEGKVSSYRFKFHIYNLGEVSTCFLKICDGEEKTSHMHSSALFLHVASHFQNKGWAISNMNYTPDFAVLYVYANDEAWDEGVPTKLEDLDED